MNLAEQLDGPERSGQREPPWPPMWLTGFAGAQPVETVAAFEYAVLVRMDDGDRAPTSH